jgi:hypothetical protein
MQRFWYYKNLYENTCELFIFLLAAIWIIMRIHIFSTQLKHALEENPNNFLHFLKDVSLDGFSVM